MLTFNINKKRFSKERFDPSFYHPLIDTMERNARNSSNINFLSLSHISSNVTLGHAFKRKYVGEDEGIMLLNAKNIRQSLINYNDAVFIDEFDNEKLKKSILSPEDLLITITGQFSGVSTVVPKNIERCNISANISKITLKKEHDPYYVSTFLNSKYGKLLYHKYSVFSTYRHIGLADLKEMKIPLFDLDTQKKLGEFARKSEKYRIESEKIINKAQESFNTIIDIDISKLVNNVCFNANLPELFNTFNPRFHSEFFKEIISLLRKKHTTILLDEIADITRGIEVGSKNYEEEGEIRFIRTKDMVNYETDLFSDYYVNQEMYDEWKTKVYEKDILLTKDGKIGYNAMILPNEKCIPSSGIAIIRTDMVPQEYLFLVINSIFCQIQLEKNVVIGTTIPHLSLDVIKNLEIPVFEETEEMKNIISLVKKAFNLKNKARNLINEGIFEVEKYVKEYLTLDD